MRRAALARALAVNPGILLMDEAFSALDPLIRTEMQDELLRLQSEQARTVVFITHDLAVAHQVADNILVMRNGVIVERGDRDGFYSNPRHAYSKQLFNALPSWEKRIREGYLPTSERGETVPWALGLKAN